MSDVVLLWKVYNAFCATAGGWEGGRNSVLWCSNKHRQMSRVFVPPCVKTILFVGWFSEVRDYNSNLQAGIQTSISGGLHQQVSKHNCVT